MQRDEIENLRAKALNDRLSRETVLVEIQKPPMSFKIDERDTEKWSRQLISENKAFSMTNLHTGVIVWVDESKNISTEELCKMMASKQRLSF